MICAIRGVLRRLFCDHRWQELRPLKIGQQPGVVEKCTRCGAVNVEYVYRGAL